MRRGVIAVITGGLCLALSPSQRPGPALARPADSARRADAGGPATPESDPVRFLERTRDRVRTETKGYRAKLHKRERIDGTLHPPEAIRVSVRAQPYAVRMRWESGGRAVLGATVEGLVYGAGVNGDRTTVWRPTASLSFLRHFDVKPTDAASRQAARYSIAEAGLMHAAERTARVWRAAADAGTLKYAYAGVRRDDRVGGRACHVFTRTNATPAVDSFLLDEPAPSAAEKPGEAIAQVKIWVDVETGLQLGSELVRGDGELVGAYFFTHLELGPSFAADEFAREGLR